MVDGRLIYHPPFAQSIAQTHASIGCCSDVHHPSRKGHVFNRFGRIEYQNKVDIPSMRRTDLAAPSFLLDRRSSCSCDLPKTTGISSLADGGHISIPQPARSMVALALPTTQGHLSAS